MPAKVQLARIENTEKFYILLNGSLPKHYLRDIKKTSKCNYDTQSYLRKEATLNARCTISSEKSDQFITVRIALNMTVFAFSTRL